MREKEPPIDFKLASGPSEPRPPYSRIVFEGGTNFDELHRIGGNLRLEALWGLGIDGALNHFMEELPGGGRDSLNLGDLHLTLRIIDEPFLRVRIGAGAAWLSDDVDTEWGFNATANAEIDFWDPFYVGLQCDGGTLGDAGLLHARASLGVKLGMLDTFIGYDHYSIGSAKLNGMVFGVGVRF